MKTKLCKNAVAFFLLSWGRCRVAGDSRKKSKKKTRRRWDFLSGICVTAPEQWRTPSRNAQGRHHSFFSLFDKHNAFLSLCSSNWFPSSVIVKLPSLFFCSTCELSVTRPHNLFCLLVFLRFCSRSVDIVEINSDIRALTFFGRKKEKKKESFITTESWAGPEAVFLHVRNAPWRAWLGLFSDAWLLHMKSQSRRKDGRNCFWSDIYLYVYLGS